MLGILHAYLMLFCYQEESQGMAEYGLILALVAVVCTVGFGTLGCNIDIRVSSISFGSARF